MVTLEPLDVAGVYLRWDWMRAGIQRVIDKTAAHYRPEDVYARIRAGTAWAYVYADGGDEIGFMVLTQEPDPDGLAIFVWVLWCETGTAVSRRSEMYGAMDTLARACKAKRIRWHSSLRGWERERYGTKVAVVFEREVDYG